MTKQVLALISDEWHALPPKRDQWGVWITQHRALPADADVLDHPTHTVQRAWLLQGDEFPPQERSVWPYIRYVVMHFERPWNAASRPPSPKDPRFFGTTYPVGLAAFAPFADTQDLYLETMWAGLWGRGRLLRGTAAGVLTEIKVLWVS